jgi:hypothetical protein
MHKIRDGAKSSQYPYKLERPPHSGLLRSSLGARNGSQVPIHRREKAPASPSQYFRVRIACVVRALVRVHTRRIRLVFHKRFYTRGNYNNNRLPLKMARVTFLSPSRPTPRLALSSSASFPPPLTLSLTLSHSLALSHAHIFRGVF